MISAFCARVGAIFIPPSVTPIKRSNPASSNTARWLSTRPVRRPTLLSSTALSKSPVLIIPFITMLALPVETYSTARIAERKSSASWMIFIPSSFTPAFAAADSIFAWSPNKVKLANPCSEAIWQAISTASSCAAATATLAGSDCNTSSISSEKRVIIALHPPVPEVTVTAPVSNSCG